MENTNNNEMANALAIVEQEVMALGYSRISPASLLALGEQREFMHHTVRRAYRMVMAGFASLLAPV